MRFSELIVAGKVLDGRRQYGNSYFCIFLTVRIENTRHHAGGPAVEGKTIAVQVDGENLFAYHESSLPDRIHAGIIGYGSINRFYSFHVRRP